jgi:mRNA-degrading endonuclease RelE of RelBE toxin-antitoxin system
VAQAIVTLRGYPKVSGIKALRGALKGTLRLRVGSYRVLFEFSADVLTITAIDDRKDAY